MTMSRQVTCVICGDPIVRRHSKTTACSEECRAERRRQTLKHAPSRVDRPWVLVECVICGSTFRKFGNTTTCSLECSERKKASSYTRWISQPGKREMRKEYRVSPDVARRSNRLRYIRRLNRTPEERERDKADQLRRDLERSAALVVIRSLDSDGSNELTVPGCNHFARESDKARAKRLARQRAYNKLPKRREKVRLHRIILNARKTAAIQAFRALEREIPELDRQIEEHLALLQPQQEMSDDHH